METITLEFIEEAITLEITGTATWDSLAGKPTTFTPSAHNQSVTTIIAEAFQAPAFANPLVCDATLHKDFKTGLITGNTTINLTNVVDGDAGMIEFIIDGTGGYTVVLGAMFTKNIGGSTIDATANKDNIVCWRKVGSDIIYSIGQIS
jgi:autotransporter translocation and assembly factor TamB